MVGLRILGSRAGASEDFCRHSSETEVLGHAIGRYDQKKRKKKKREREKKTDTRTEAKRGERMEREKESETIPKRKGITYGPDQNHPSWPRRIS